MTSVHASSARSSHVSTPRPAVESKATSAPRREESAPAARPMQFRDEFVSSSSQSGGSKRMHSDPSGGSSSTSSTSHGQLSKQLEPYRAKLDETVRKLQSNPDLNTDQERREAARAEVRKLGIPPAQREEAVKYILDKMAPTAHSPGKDQLGQGDGGPVAV